MAEEHRFQEEAVEVVGVVAFYKEGRGAGTEGVVEMGTMGVLVD
jgi:hypothetical protein